MGKFTVKNFKSFDSSGVSLDLSAINILTGTNSSGKSSYVKAMLLLSDYLQQLRENKDAKKCYLRFSNKKLNLGSYKTALHVGSNSTMVFEYETKYETDAFMKPFKVSLTFIPSGNSNLGFGHLKQGIISYDGHDFFRIQEDGERIIYFKEARSLYLQKLEKEMQNERESWDNIQNENLRERLKENYDLRKEMLKRQSVCIFPIMKEIGEMSAAQFKQFCNNRSEQACGQDEYSVNFKYRPLIDKVIELFEKSGESTVEIFFEKLERDYNRQSGMFDAYSIGWQAIVWPEPTPDGTTAICCGDEGNYDVQEKHCVDFELAVALFYWLSFNIEVVDGKRHLLSLTFLDLFVVDLVENVLFTPALYPLVYLPSEKANVQRLYSIDDSGDTFQEVLLDYFKAREAFDSLQKRNENCLFYKDKFASAELSNFQPGDFINKWVKNFSIGDHVKLHATEDGLGVVLYLYQSEDNSDGHLLADEGYGISQLISILISAETCILKGFGPMDDVIYESNYSSWESNQKKWPGGHYYKLLIEEPEIHLHPRLQSIIADMLWELLYKYKILSIVETHSEYLVRKLQVLCAKYVKEHDGSQAPVRVFYFEKGKGAYDLDMRPDGKFRNEFGSGFFDEAANLAFEIL